MKTAGTRLRFFAVGLLRAQVEQRQVRVLRADHGQQLNARLFVHDPAAREPHVRQHAQQIRLVAPAEVHGLLVGLRHQDLRPGPHPEDAVLVVDRLLHGRLGLGDDFLVEDRQQRGVVNRGVLDQNDDPHLGPLGVEGHVHAVLEVLDQGQQQVRCSPARRRPGRSPRGRRPLSSSRCWPVLCTRRKTGRSGKFSLMVRPST